MISIIGAGPIGCYTAYLLTKAGKTVQVFEKKAKIGIPVRCTGLVTQKIYSILPLLPNNTIANKVTKVIINSRNQSISFKLKKPEIILDRTKFDLYLYNLAKKAGAKFYLSHNFKKIKQNTLIINHKNKSKLFKTDILIGADGPNSKIAKLINNKPPKLTMGIQARIKTKQNQSAYQVFLGKEYGTFAWIVPESNTISKVGILTKNLKQFQSFTKQINGKILNYSSGQIPIYKKIKLHKNNIYIVGDAAAQIKNTTGGGIIYGLLSAQCLAQSIIKNQNYTRLFNKKIKKSLFLHNIIYKIMGSFEDKNYDNLIKLCKSHKIKGIIEEADREHPIRMLIKIIIKEPKFLFFLPKLIRKV